MREIEYLTPIMFLSRLLQLFVLVERTGGGILLGLCFRALRTSIDSSSLTD